MSESLVVIRTFGTVLEADEAQVELLAAGVYSLLYSEEGGAQPARRPDPAVVLAVHKRDAQIAEAVLTPRPRIIP
jgi:hypothetical protein